MGKQATGYCSIIIADQLLSDGSGLFQQEKVQKRFEEQQYQNENQTEIWSFDCGDTLDKLVQFNLATQKIDWICSHLSPRYYIISSEVLRLEGSYLFLGARWGMLKNRGAYNVILNHCSCNQVEFLSAIIIIS